MICLIGINVWNVMVLNESSTYTRVILYSCAVQTMSKFSKIVSVNSLFLLPIHRRVPNTSKLKTWKKVPNIRDRWNIVLKYKILSTNNNWIHFCKWLDNTSIIGRSHRVRKGIQNQVVTPYYPQWTCSRHNSSTNGRQMTLWHHGAQSLKKIDVKKEKIDADLQ